MDNLFLADVEDSTVAEHPCGASALLDVVVAVEVEQASDPQFCEISAHRVLLSVLVLYTRDPGKSNHCPDGDQLDNAEVEQEVDDCCKTDQLQHGALLSVLAV